MLLGGINKVHELIDFNATVEVPDFLRKRFLECVLKPEVFYIEQKWQQWTIRFVPPSCADYIELDTCTSEEFEDLLLAATLDCIASDTIWYKRDDSIPLRERLKLLIEQFNKLPIALFWIQTWWKAANMFLTLMREARNPDFFVNTQNIELFSDKSKRS